MNPPSRSRYSTRSALAEIWEREIECSDREMTLGVAEGLAGGASGEFNSWAFGLSNRDGSL